MKIYATDNFRKTRIKKGFSLVALAEKAELSKQAIGQVERRANGISPAKAIKVIELLQTDFDNIFELVERDGEHGKTD